MTSFIWSLSQLDRLSDHAETTVQEWAVSKLFHLYPEQAQSRLPRLLSSDREAVVKAALEHLGKEPREDLIELLKELYLNGSDSVSGRAVHVLGNWKVSGAVDWMQERILQERPPGKEQIAAMIYALGHIPDENAYSLLKQTEKAMEEKDSSYRDLFYASLLRHRRLEDVETLLNVILDNNQKEERRRNALGLLLAQVDSALNPSDVFFVNHQAVQRHWLQRSAELGKGKADHADLSIEAIEEVIERLDPDRIPGSLESLHQLAERVGGGSIYEEGILCRSLERLKNDSGATDEWRYGLLCLVVSALLAVLEEKVFPPPSARAHWREKIDYLLRNRPSRVEDEAYRSDVVRESDRSEWLALLISTLRDAPESWGALRAVEMLGKGRAVEAAETLIHSLKKTASDELFLEAARTALLRMGAHAVPHLIPLLESSVFIERFFASGILGQLPTREGVDAVRARVSSLYKDRQTNTLDAVYEMGAREFLEFLEEEYRPGEQAIGRVYVHLCRVNELQTERLREIERDVKQAEALTEENRRFLSGESTRWPSSIQLELACKECGKVYQYDIHEVHFHPHSKSEEEGEQDLTPYQQGVVICDDLRCKNCRALNRLELTQKTFAQLTAESVKLLALHRAGRQVPSSYPVKHVQLDERDGKPLTLPDVRQEHLNTIRRNLSAPAPHLALAKFYEYVKEYANAKYAYLKALDLDARASEAMAGLARIHHAEEDFEKAVEWIENCYESLEKGNVYLTQDAAEFKKAVRQKRREFSRELGIKPEEKPVEVRFRMETSKYPKNKPCPCGSGKKYKLCCMEKDEQ